MTEGDLIIQIVPLGTGSESTVSNRDISRMNNDSAGLLVLQDSAAVGLIRNPDCQYQGQDGRGQSGVWGWCKGGIQ